MSLKSRLPLRNVLATVTVQAISRAGNDLRTIRGVQRDEVVEGQMVGVGYVLVADKRNPMLTVFPADVCDDRLA